MKITKTEIKNHIEERNPIATYYGGLVGLGLKIYDFDNFEEVIYFVEFAGTKETPKKSRVLPTAMVEAASVGDIGSFGWTNV